MMRSCHPQVIARNAFPSGHISSSSNAMEWVSTAERQLSIVWFTGKLFPQALHTPIAAKRANAWLPQIVMYFQNTRQSK